MGWRTENCTHFMRMRHANQPIRKNRLYFQHRFCFFESMQLGTINDVYYSLQYPWFSLCFAMCLFNVTLLCAAVAIRLTECLLWPFVA